MTLRKGYPSADDWLPEDWVVCNCRTCNRTLVSQSPDVEQKIKKWQKQTKGVKKSLVESVDVLAGRVGDVPYCCHCIDIARGVYTPKPNPKMINSPTVIMEDASPWQDNAIRQLEDG